MSLTAALGCLLLAPATVAAQTPNFSGFYVGALTGIGAGSLTTENNDDLDHRPSGGIFGVKAGFNRVSDKMLLGAEVDLAATGIDGEESVTLSGFTSDLTHDVTMLNTFRGRIGGIFGNAVIYGTGGFATGRVNGDLLVTTSGIEVGRDEWSSTHTGWTYGAGIDVAINERLSLTADYLRIDFSPEDVEFGVGGFTITDTGDLNTNTVRIGVNLRF